MATTTYQNKSTNLTDRELVDTLRCFPRGVLPVAVLRELMSRGPAIEDELLRPLRSAVADAGKGVGSIPGECFFCFGLLLANPSARQLPVIEQLLRLSESDLDQAIGDLKHNGLIALLVGIARTADVDEVLAWIDRMIADDSVNVWSRWSCVSALTFLVREELLDRSAAIDRLVSMLKQRSSETYDRISAASVTELSNLRAVEADSFVAECFDQNRIDNSIFCWSDWEQERDETLTVEQKLNQLPELQFDIVEILETWHGFRYVSNSLDPREPACQLNPDAGPSWASSGLSKREIDQHLLAIRESSGSSFPRAAVKALGIHTEQVKEQLIAEVRAGMLKAGGLDARASNAPYLALTILIARAIPLPSELLLAILDLPDDQRMDLFGDSMHSAFVIAASLSLQGDTGPIDRRIVDPQRLDIDRAELAGFYYLSAYNGFLRRTEAIDRLAELLRQTQGQSPILTASLTEALCLMSAVGHRSSVTEAIAAGAGSSRFSDAELLGMLDDPEQAKALIQKDLKQYRDVIAQIEGSVMFDREALQPPKTRVQPSHGQKEQLPTSVSTIRNAAPKLGRNSPCHCGSGKKYKKCCLGK